MRPVTIADLRKIAGGSAPLSASLIEPINRHCADVGITTPLRMAHFLAHMAHETGGFKQLEENLDYTAKRLMQVWPKRFPTLASAQPYANNPQKLANKVYGGRLGNTGPNDGWKFRGSGPYQLTGKDNFDKFGKAAGVDLVSNPDAARDPDTGVEVAARYFMARMAKAADRDDIAATTKALNGGTLGLAERREMLERAKACFVMRAGFAALPDEAGDADDIEVPSIPDEPVGLLDEPKVDNNSEASDKAVVENVQYTDEHRVKLVQTWLRNLGYPEVGQPNGEIGTFTLGAIRDYRADKGLPAGDYIDDQLMLALATDTEPRKPPASRTDATAAEIRDKVPEAKATWISKIWANITATIGAFGAGVTALWSKIKDNLGDARGYLEPVRDFLGDVPTWVWFALVAGAAYLLSRQLHAGEKASIEAFKDGSRR